jgi:hypothetical protein
VSRRQFASSYASPNEDFDLRCNASDKVDAERRRFVRYNVLLPVVFGAKQGDRTQVGTGFSRDIGAGGVFVFIDQKLLQPELGKMIWMRITVPGSPETRRPWSLDVDARIERVEANGLAVSFTTVPD